MTKTVRILSVLAAITVVIVVTLPTVFSSQVSAEDKQFLDAPGIVEQYKDIKNTQSDKSEPPLVTQAKKFALYLNPPKPKIVPKPRQANATPAAPKVRPVTPVKAKFDLEGTSFFPDNPELSMALISEPGKGLRWVRQSSNVGHLKIKEVFDGKITIQDGQRTYDMQAKRQPTRSLIKGENSSVVMPNERSGAVTSVNTTSKSSGASPTTVRPRTRSASNRKVSPRPAPVQSLESQVTPKQMELMDKFSKEIENIDDVNELEKRMKKFMNDFDNIDTTEANDLKELGEKLSQSKTNK